MPAAYDNYDYTSYWKGRGYEHLAENYALSEFLKQIPKVNKILEIGAGFGRLYPIYENWGEHIILSDPSGQMLKKARSSIKSKKVKFLHCSLENIERKIKPGSIDLIIMVRVLHHIENPDKCFGIVSRLLKPNGYFILEYANKIHFKSNLKELFKGNIMYIHDIFPKKVSKKKSKEKCLPLYNFHPHQISQYLIRNKLQAIERRSVSNIRSTTVKKLLSVNIIIFFEKLLQKILGKFDFGPSIFILAKRKKVITDYLASN